MNINELMKSLADLNKDMKYLVEKTKFDCYDDLSEMNSDRNNPDDNQLMSELRVVMLHISDASKKINYLQSPIKGEYVLSKNRNGRYECSIHEFTSGNLIEYYAYDEYDECYRWVISRVEHNGNDYYIVGSQTLTSDRSSISLEGLRVRIR